MTSIINLDLDRDFQRYFQISILSKRFRIMMYVMSNPGCSIKYAQAESGLSYRGFHMKLKEMLDAQLITLDEDPEDGRRKRMNIGPEGRMAQQRFLDANAGDGSVTVPVPEYGAALAGE